MACIPFQSTLSLRRATGQPMCPVRLFDHFNPRSPCGERPDSFWGLLRFIQFQSTLSLRRATSGRANCSASPRISIHALLAESDPTPFGSISIAGLISIHALLAESDLSPLSHDRSNRSFQSTLSLRRATGGLVPTDGNQGISIHALLAESDEEPYECTAAAFDFNPRSPCGERL